MVHTDIPVFGMNIQNLVNTIVDVRPPACLGGTYTSSEEKQLRFAQLQFMNKLEVKNFPEHFRLSKEGSPVINKYLFWSF